jgi:hypothetical protein
MSAGASQPGGTGLQYASMAYLLAQPEIRDAGCRYASTHLAGVTSGQGADLARGSGAGGHLTKEFTAA